MPSDNLAAVSVSGAVYETIVAAAAARGTSVRAFADEMIGRALGPQTPAPATRDRACSACGQPGHYARTCGRPSKTKHRKYRQRCTECDQVGHNALTCPEARRVAERLATGVDPAPPPRPEAAEPAPPRPRAAKRGGGATMHIPGPVCRALDAEVAAIKARTGRDLTPSQLAAELLRAAIGPRQET